MVYKPSPRPEYDGPTLIRFENVVRHLWGDADAGQVADWIYISNRNIHAIVYSLLPGKTFTHSQEYRTIFGADEVMIVLDGVFALANPQSGEVQRARAGEAIFFRKDTWHHGFNLGENPVRVLEFFAPPPAQGTSGIYAQNKPYLPKETWQYINPHALRGWPRPNQLPGKSLVKIREDELLWELRGGESKMLVGHFASTEHLRVGRLDVPPGFRSPAERHAGDEFLYLNRGSLSIYLPSAEGENGFELRPEDGFYIPAGVEHEYHNTGEQPAQALFGVAPNPEPFQEE